MSKIVVKVKDGMRKTVRAKTEFAVAAARHEESTQIIAQGAVEERDLAVTVAGMLDGLMQVNGIATLVGIDAFLQRNSSSIEKEIGRMKDLFKEDGSEDNAE